VTQKFLMLCDEPREKVGWCRVRLIDFRVRCSLKRGDGHGDDKGKMATQRSAGRSSGPLVSPLQILYRQLCQRVSGTSSFRDGRDPAGRHNIWWIYGADPTSLPRQSAALAFNIGASRP